MSAHRTRLGVVVVVAGVTAATLSPSAVSAAPANTVSPAARSLSSVVATTMKVRATVEIHSDLVPVSSRTAASSYTCAGVVVGDDRVATSSMCVDPTLDFVLEDLRDQAVDNLAHDWSLSKATTARLKRLAQDDEWKVTTPGLSTPPTPDYTIHSIIAPDHVIETAATRVPVRNGLIGVLDAKRQIPDVTAARTSTVTETVGTQLSIATFDPDADLPENVGPKLTVGTIAGHEDGRVKVTAEIPSTGLGAPVFDARGRLFGITTRWGSPTLVTNAAAVKSALAKASAPRTRPSESSPTSAPTTSTTSSTTQRLPTSDVTDRSTDSRADEEPSEPMSTWTKVALGFGFVDVIVLGAVVVAYRRRRG